MDPHLRNLLDQAARHLAGSLPPSELKALAPRTKTTCLPLREWTARHIGDYFPLPPSRFHRWLIDELGTLHTRRASRLNVRAPRGAAKSTWASFAYPLWAAIHHVEPYILILSDTGDQAKKYLEGIAAEVEGNPTIAEAHPDVAGRGPVWRSNAIRLRNGVLIEAMGTGAKIRGRRNRAERPSLILVDDPQNEEHVISPVKRERSWQWLSRAVVPAGSPQTNVVVLGTSLHPEAIVCQLGKTPGWVTRSFKSLDPLPERMDLWDEWESMLLDHGDQNKDARAREFYERNEPEMARGGGVLWPEREDLYSLMLMRATIGHAAFDSEKQDNPIDPSMCEWPEEYFDYGAFWFEQWPKHLDVRVVSLDPSKGKDAKKGDYSAITKYGLANNGVEYVESDQARRTVDVMCADTARHVLEFSPDALVIEANAWQDLLAAPMEAALRDVGATVTVYMVDNAVPKPVRIRRWTGPLARKSVRFKSRSPGTTLCVMQMQQFPHGAHDDGPDSAEMARRKALELLASGIQSDGDILEA